MTFKKMDKAAWEAVKGNDSKYEAFEQALTELLRTGTRKVIVFSFFIKTIDYLASRLAQFEFDGESADVFKLYGPIRKLVESASGRKFTLGASMAPPGPGKVM